LPGGNAAYDERERLLLAIDEEESENYLYSD
jgi:hypothetical protein